MKYAGFSSRAGAAIIDFFVLLPFAFLFLWAQSFKGAAMYLALPASALGPAYHIWFHARSGQTLGKRFVGIRVIRVDGERISWREACLRSSVDVAYGVAQCVATLMALQHLYDAQVTITWYEGSALVAEYGPAWGKLASYAAAAWGWSELIFMFFNEQRRALHDLIAGTVVVHESVEAARELPSLGSV